MSFRKVPTTKQYDDLRILGNGCAGLCFTKRQTEPYLRRGWVTAKWYEEEKFYSWVRITPDGLRALADAVEKYGLPEIGKKPDEAVR